MAIATYDDVDRGSHHLPLIDESGKRVTQAMIDARPTKLETGYVTRATEIGSCVMCAHNHDRQCAALRGSPEVYPGARCSLWTGIDSPIPVEVYGDPPNVLQGHEKTRELPEIDEPIAYPPPGGGPGIVINIAQMTINGSLVKSDGHKYKSRKMIGGKWVYDYGDDRGHKRRHIPFTRAELKAREPQYSRTAGEKVQLRDDNQHPPYSVHGSKDAIRRVFREHKDDKRHHGFEGAIFRGKGGTWKFAFVERGDRHDPDGEWSDVKGRTLGKSRDGGAPGKPYEQQAMPDFQELYYTPSSPENAERERKSSEERRVKSAKENSGRFGIHGRGPLPQLRYDEGDYPKQERDPEGLVNTKPSVKAPRMFIRSPADGEHAQSGKKKKKKRDGDGR